MNDGKSIESIKAILNNLSEYLDNDLILFERYHVPFQELETRKDIRFARVALYEMTEDVTTQVDDKRANMSLVQFGLDISVVRAYRKDNDSRGEEPLLNIRDNVIEWSKQVSVPELSDNILLAMGYSLSTNIIRNDKFVNRSILFEAIKDVQKRQVFLNTFDETFNETFA